MNGIPSDTDPRVHAMLIEHYRTMTPAQKLRCVGEMQAFARKLVMMDLRRRYPEAGEHELRMRMASRWLPRDLMIKAYGWDPDEKGY